MTSYLRHTDRPHSSILPRWRDRARDAHHYGEILPMEQPRKGWLARIVGRG